MYCKDWSLVKHLSHGIGVQPLFCRSWKCEECAPRRANQLKWQALDGKPTTFLTLTASKKEFATADEAARALALSWRKLRLAAMKRFRLKAFPFLAVFEKHKSGRPHLHIICRVSYIPQRWLSAMMKKFINSPVVDIRKVKSFKGAVRYVTKYVSKDTHKFEGTKRYWCSKDWDVRGRKFERPVFEANERFDVREAPWWHVVMQYLNQGMYGRCEDGAGYYWSLTAERPPP